MDYGEIKSLKKRFFESEGDYLNSGREKEEGPIFTNPLQKYNYFIENYNIDYNIVNQKRLNPICCEKLYSNLFILQMRWIHYIIIFGVMPMILYLFKLFFLKASGLYFIIITVYLSLIFTITSFTLILFLVGKRTYKLNYKLVKNPFIQMIYHSDVCRMLKVNNQKVEFNTEDLSQLNLTQNQISMIKSRPIYNGKVKFMIYDQNFVDLYSEIEKTSAFKHIFWFISSMGFYILYFYLFF
jgi:hypothetical protein